MSHVSDLANLDAAELAATLIDLLEDAESASDSPVKAFWVQCEGGHAPVVFFGSPGEGSVFRLTVEQLVGAAAEQVRVELREEYDTFWAKQYDETLEEFRAHLAQGWTYDGYEPYVAAQAGASAS